MNRYLNITCTASLARPVAISMVYTLLFFISPWLLVKRKSQRTTLKYFSIVTGVLGTLFMLAHLITHVINSLFSLWGKNRLTEILREIGFINFKGLQ